MATPPEFGRNKHQALLHESRATVDRLLGTLAEMVDEIDGQMRQSRPRLEGVAVLVARATKQGTKAAALLSETNELVVGMRAKRSDVDDLQDQLNELRALLSGALVRMEVNGDG